MANKYITKPAKISIAICTRERPIMLTNLLKSFQSIEILQNVDVQIDIIENHTETNLAKLICNLAPSLPFKINHHWEPKIGIPIARNHALRVARESNATHIIFIDDDELVAPQWLKELWNTYLQYDENTIIQGAVASLINTTKNKHLHQLFQRGHKKTGDRMQLCATNNVIVQLEVLKKHNIYFDESRPLAGGTDSKLFRKAAQRGIPMIFCADAIVYEDIPEERITISWLSKRHFRTGLTYGEHYRATGAGLMFPAARSWDLFRYSLRALTYIIKLNKYKFQKRWLKICRTCGRILGFFHYRIDSYKKTDGQ